MSISRLLYQNILWRGLFFTTSFILNILIAKYLGASISGNLYYLISVYAFVTLIASLSLESGINFYSSKGLISSHSLLSFCLLWIVILCAIMSIIFYFTRFFSRNNFDTQFFLYSLLFIAGNILITYLTAIFYSKKKFIIPSLTGVIINIILIAFITTLMIIKPGLSSTIVFIVYFCSFFIQGLALFACLLLELNKPFKFTLPTIFQLKLLFRYCLIAFFANFISFLLYRVDYWFVNRYCNPADLGNYIQVSKLAQMFFVLPGILASTIFPLTAGDQRPQVNSSLMMLSRSLFFCYGLICLVLAATGNWLFPLIFGASYNGMYVPFIFLIPGILGLSTLYTLSAYYAGKNKVSVNIKGSALALIFMITGDIVFVPKYGIVAAAIVSSVSYITYHVYVLSVFTKEYKVNAIDFFRFKFSDLQRIKQLIFK